MPLPGALMTRSAATSGPSPSADLQAACVHGLRAQQHNASTGLTFLQLAGSAAPKRVYTSSFSKGSVSQVVCVGPGNHPCVLGLQLALG